MAETLHSQDPETDTPARAQIPVPVKTLPPEDLNVVRPMPRRATRHTAITAVTLPRARHVHFKAGVLRPIGRLLVWLWNALKFFAGNLVDILLRRDTVQRRAIRLRRIFESMGASLTKLGQQLSLRADLLPYAYCAELGKMLD